MSDWRSRAKRVETKAPSSKPEPRLPEADRQSVPETALHSGLQGVSFKLFDELQGAMGAVDEGGAMLRQAVGLEDKPEVLADPVDGSSPPERSAMGRLAAAYAKSRDAERGAVSRGERDNPGTALSAELLGGIAAPSPIKGGSMAQQGAAAGALYGLGGSEGGPLEMAADTVTGGATGALAGKLLGGASNWLKRGAETRALRAAGAQKPDLTALAKASPSGDKSAEARRLGRRLLEMTDDDGKRILGWLDNPEAIAPKLAKATDETGQAIGGTVQRIQDATANVPLTPTSIPGRPVNMVTLGRRLLAQSDDAARRPGQAEYAAALRREAEQLLQQADDRVAAGEHIAMTLPEVEAAKQALAKRIRPADWLTSESAAGASAKKDASRAFRRASEEAIDSLAGPEEKELFQALKGRYKDVRTLRDIAQRGEVSEAARMPMGLTEQNAMSAALMSSQGLPPVEQLLRGGAAAGGSRLIRGRGDALAARTMEAVSDVPGPRLLRATTESFDEQRRRWLEEKLRGLAE